MKERDRKIKACEFDYWIIFIYIHVGGTTKIALFDKNSEWIPYTTQSSLSWEAVRDAITNDLGINERDCYKDRYVGTTFDVNLPTDDELNAWASVIRLKDASHLNPKKAEFKNFKWVTKKEAESMLTNKIYKKAFEIVFSKDSFWESLETE